ncbi:hypothetical protein PUN28_008109 [Cardiocondyla obscurior]|uniref:Uncharacterized protein n=1 Tax=Cardiocondyla obscurior TaxID=286306 RepID=A0AAW2FYD7_9HYME
MYAAHFTSGCKGAINRYYLGISRPIGLFFFSSGCAFVHPLSIPLDNYRCAYTITRRITSCNGTIRTAEKAGEKERERERERSPVAMTLNEIACRLFLVNGGSDDEVGRCLTVHSSSIG